MKYRFFTNTLLLLLGCHLALLTARAQSFTATYDFALVTPSSGQIDPTPPPTAAGVTFGSFASFGASANSGANGRFYFTSQPVGGIHQVNNFSQFTGSLNPTNYFEVSITPLSFTQLQLDSITFTSFRSFIGIRSYAVRSSLDGYTENLAASINNGNPNLGIGPDNEFRILIDADGGFFPQSGNMVTLGSEFVGLTTPVTFRFYAWNAEASTGAFSLDNVVFSGQSVSIPEPSATALLAGSLAALGISRRSKK
ncbi:MAG: PEP-CTERM sorting domain-containing protein [Verrucomicrobiota bacterium]